MANPMKAVASRTDHLLTLYSHTDVKNRCDPHKTLWLDIKMNRQTRMHMDCSDRGFIWIDN